MKIEQVSAEALKREFNITVPAEAIENRVENKLKAVSAKAKLPGFRPGKAPMDVIRKSHGKRVQDEVLQEMLDKSAQEALEKQGVRPAMPPRLKNIKFEDGSPLTFSIECEVMPEVPSIDYSKLKATKLVPEIADKDVQEALVKLAERVRKFDKVERTAKKGDQVLIDFEGFTDDKPFAGGKGEGFQLELGSGMFIPGFEDQLIGSKAGDEVTVNIKFPEEYHAKNLAGKDAKFEVKINEVQQKSNQKVDESLAKEMGLEDLDKLKEAINAQLSKEMDSFCRSYLKKQIFDTLDEKHKFDVPAGMVEEEFKGIWEQVQKYSAPEGESEKELEKRKKEFQTMSERRVRLGIILADLAREQNITVSKEELRDAMIKQANQYPGKQKEIYEHFQQHPHAIDTLKGPILEEKAVDFILSKVKLEDKKVSLDELRELEKKEMGEE